MRGVRQQGGDRQKEGRGTCPDSALAMAICGMPVAVQRMSRLRPARKARFNPALEARPARVCGVESARDPAPLVRVMDSLAAESVFATLLIVGSG